MVYGAILAGGMGRRVEKSSIPKQFISIGGNPIIVMTLRKFLSNEKIDYIYVAMKKEWIEYAKKMFIHNFTMEEYNRIHIVVGGKERLDSFTNIMEDIIGEYGINDDDILICHDAVRPFVTQQMICDCIEATDKYKIALTVIPVADTIHSAQNKDFIDGSPDRSTLYNGQTPSGFNIKLLKEVCDKVSLEDRGNFTGTTQIMLKFGYKIRMVKGHPSNFKITTDNDLDVAERMMRSQHKNRNIEVLDCTLRDGGIVVDFDFGDERMQKIKGCLEDSGVEFIECGYINEKKGFAQGRTCFVSDKAIEEAFLYTGKKEGVKYVAMIDYGTYDVKKLGVRSEKGIDGIRLAFHKENWQDALELGRIVLDKGYELYIQPMVCMRYSDDEFRELIIQCNKKLNEASAFYIVDSFGQMDNVSIIDKLKIADQIVSDSMKIGFHAHNNRQMAFANGCTFINQSTKHELVIDSSIMGMGKGAGNLCTELIVATLAEKGKLYKTNGIYKEIAEYFSKQKDRTPWGYSLDYYLASLYGCTPSYIKIFEENDNVTTDIMVDLLDKMPESKRAACDREFAKMYLEEYFK